MGYNGNNRGRTHKDGGFSKGTFKKGQSILSGTVSKSGNVINPVLLFGATIFKSLDSCIPRNKKGCRNSTVITTFIAILVMNLAYYEYFSEGIWLFWIVLIWGCILALIGWNWELLCQTIEADESQIENIRPFINTSIVMWILAGLSGIVPFLIKYTKCFNEQIGTPKISSFTMLLYWIIVLCYVITSVAAISDLPIGSKQEDEE